MVSERDLWQMPPELRIDLDIADICARCWQAGQRFNHDVADVLC